MSRDVELIDRIVANVLRKVEAAVPAAPQSQERTSETTRSAEASHIGEKRNRRVVWLEESVITADLLNERASGAAEVAIGRRAVLTPSARDWLRQRGVDCRSAEQPAHDAGEDSGWYAFSGHADRNLEVVLAEAQRRGQGWNYEQIDDESELLATVLDTARERSNAHVIVLVEPAESFACRANRHAYVRAAVVRSDGDVRRVMRSMDANVLVVRPEGISFIGLRNVLRTYREYAATGTEAGSTT